MLPAMRCSKKCFKKNNGLQLIIITALLKADLTMACIPRCGAAFLQRLCLGAARLIMQERTPGVPRKLLGARPHHTAQWDTSKAV